MSKALKGIGIIKKLSESLPEHSLLTIHISFVRPHLDYGDMTNQIMEVSLRKLEEFNTMLLSQLQVPSKEHLRISCTAN